MIPVKRKRTISGEWQSGLLVTPELLLKIFSFLDFEDLVTCGRVSRQWARLSSDDLIWRRLYGVRFGELMYSDARKSIMGWKALFKLQHNWYRGKCTTRSLSFQPDLLFSATERHIFSLSFNGQLIVYDRVGIIRKSQFELSNLMAWNDLGKVSAFSGFSNTKSNNIILAVGFDHGFVVLNYNDIADEDRRRRTKTWKQQTNHRESDAGHTNDTSEASPGVEGFPPRKKTQIKVAEFARNLDYLEDNLKVIAVEGDVSNDGDDPIMCFAYGRSILAMISGSSRVRVFRIEHNAVLLRDISSYAPTYRMTLYVGDSCISKQGICVSIASNRTRFDEGWIVCLQELHFSLDGKFVESRAANASGNDYKLNYNPVSAISYDYPYLVTGGVDNTVTLFEVQSEPNDLTITTGQRLWGHCHSIQYLKVTHKGKAISVSSLLDDVRWWDLQKAGVGIPVQFPDKRSLKHQHAKILTFDDEELLLETERDRRKVIKLYDFR
jgi:hypothetical protein